MEVIKTPEECIDEIAEAIDAGILSPDLRAHDTLRIMTEAGYRIVKTGDEFVRRNGQHTVVIIEEWKP